MCVYIYLFDYTIKLFNLDILLMFNKKLKRFSSRNIFQDNMVMFFIKEEIED